MTRRLIFSSLLAFLVLPTLAAEIFIRASQVGYAPSNRKIGIAFSSEPLPAVFKVIKANNDSVAWSGSARSVERQTWGEFKYFSELDFSSFEQRGRFVLNLGGTNSAPFSIGTNLHAALIEPSLGFMRQQRCGYNPWFDAVCHPFDGRTFGGPMTNGTYLPCSGGWHDAGDMLKYLLTSGNATAQLLLAYQLGTESRQGQRDELDPIHADQMNALGQSGANGVADLLDEAKWGLDWMLKLHPKRGQLFHQIADDRDHRGWRLPQNETVDYGWGPGKERVVYFATGEPQGLRDFKSESTGVANLAGRYAAAMALAYQILGDDAELRGFAERCLRAGEEVYRLGREKPGVQQGNSYGAPYRYEETTWADDMEWGAAELHRATGKRRYLDDAIRFAHQAAAETWMDKEQTGHYQFYPFLNVGHFRLHGIADQKIRRALEEYYRAGIEACVARGRTNPFRAGVPFIWCSNNLMAALATQCALYERMTGDQRYRDFAACQRDWLLGRNPWGTSMITGVGKIWPRDVHLIPNKLLQKEVAGGLVDGPVYERIFKSLKGVSISQPDPLAIFQDARAVYHDDIKDYSTNEPTMDGTASLILLWAVLR